MKDPARENITGSKVEKHTFEHRINWGQVALAVAVIAVIWKASAIFDDRADEQLDEDAAETIEVEGGGLMTK